MSRSRPGLDKDDDDQDDKEGANDTLQSDMQPNRESEDTAKPTGIMGTPDATNVKGLTSENEDTDLLALRRTTLTKTWLEELYPTISLVLVPQTPPTRAVDGEAGDISPVFPSFRIAKRTPGLPPTTQIAPGTRIWIPGTPGYSDGFYGQTIPQHEILRFFGFPRDQTEELPSMMMPFRSNPNPDASTDGPVISVCLCGFHGCILDQANKTCFAGVTSGTSRYQLANEYAERGWGFYSNVEPGGQTALSQANQDHSFTPSPLKSRAMQDGVIQFLPGIDLSELELSLELDDMYGEKEDLETAIFEHSKVMDRLDRILGTLHRAGPVWPCMWLDNEVMWLARRTTSVTI